MLPFVSNWVFGYQVEILPEYCASVPKFLLAMWLCWGGNTLQLPVWHINWESWHSELKSSHPHESSSKNILYALSSRLSEFFAESWLALNIKVSLCLLSRKQHQFQTVQNWPELYLAWYCSVIDSCLTSVSCTQLLFPDWDRHGNAQVGVSTYLLGFSTEAASAPVMWA